LKGVVVLTSFDLESKITAVQGGKHFTVSVDGPTELVAPIGVQSEFISRIDVENESPFNIEVRSELSSEVEGSPEWQVKLYLDGVLKWDSLTNLPSVFETKLGQGKHFATIQVSVASGASYGDSTAVSLTVSSRGITETRKFSVAVRPSILAVKAAIGQEREVADSIAAKAKTGDLGIYSVLLPSTIRGYVFLEAMNTDKIENAVRGIRKSHGLVKGETSLEEVSHFLTPKPTVSGIVEGDIVELISGPFKGEKARVQRIDNAKEEITVELFEAVVPIPVTVRGDHVRVLEKERH
jgi:transcriptional antiterminator NusG